MKRGALLAAGLLWPGAVEAGFHPIEDRRYRYDTEQTRVADGVVRRFHARRAVVFHRTAAGFDAVVTLEAVDHSPADQAGDMFARATAALLRQPLRFRLDRDGRLLDVADADAALGRVVGAIVGVGEGRRAGSLRPERLRALAAPLRTASAERKAAMLLSILRPVVTPDDAERPPGRTPVTLPARSPLAVDAALTGTETVTRDATGLVTIETVAGGNVTAAPPRDLVDAPAAAVTTTVTLRATRTVDTVAGLLRDSRERRDTVLGGAAHGPGASVETVVRLRLEAE